jgi:hypothetical protein
MDLDRWRVQFETFYIRFRTFIKTGVRLAGVGVVLLGAFNLLSFVSTVTPIFTGYRTFGISLFGPAGSYYADVLLVLIGSAIAWFA